MNRSTFWMLKYMKGSIFSKARYMNGVGFEILSRTSVPKLPPEVVTFPTIHDQKLKLFSSLTRSKKIVKIRLFNLSSHDAKVYKIFLFQS